MKTAKKILTALFAVSFCLFCLFYPVQVKSAVGEGINRCITIIIPSLYAMMAASALLLKSGVLSTAGRWISPVTQRIFGLNGECGAVFLFSLVSGYPVGAKLIYSMYAEGRLPKKTAEIMSGLCFGSGAAFIFGCVAATSEIGMCVLVSNLAAEIIMAVALSAYFRKHSISENVRNTAISADILTNSVASSGRALGDMCLCVVIFAVFAEMAKYCGLSLLFKGNIYEAVLDITAISEISVDIPTTAALISFGGVCVLFQISAIFRGKLSIVPLVVMRICAAFLTYLICGILQPFFISGTVDVFTSGQRIYSEKSPVPSVMLILMAGVVIAETAKLRKKMPAE